MVDLQVMKNNKQLWFRSKERLCVGLIPLFALLLIAGCMAGVKKTPESTAEGGLALGESIVSRFESGKKGFVITEKANLDAQTSRDFYRAVDSLAEGDYDQAIELLEKVVKTSPSVTAPYVNLAIAYGMVGKPALAEEHLKSALFIFPRHPVASNEYGLLLRKTGRFTEAKHVYEQTLTMFPEYLPARRNLGILCDLYLNDYECALEQYQQYSEADPEDAQVKLWLSELLLRHGE